MGDDNQLHAVAYGGQALTPSQRRWTPAHLELAGLALALKQYECFAVHKEVIVITDNSHVLHLEQWLQANARERRLIAYLCSSV